MKKKFVVTLIFPLIISLILILGASSYVDASDLSKDTKPKTVEEKEHAKAHED